MNSQNKVWIALVVIGIIAILGNFNPSVKSAIQSFGGVTNYDEVDATAMKIGGANGSRVGPVVTGQCALTVPLASDSVAASTTAVFSCAVTGVVSGDIVLAQFATTTAPSPAWGTTAGSWSVVNAAASSTAGFITVKVQNQTGGTAPLSASGIASTTNYIVMHPVSTVPGL